MERIALVANRIRGYAGDDPEMRAIVDELETARFSVAAPMAPMAIKEMHLRAAGPRRRGQTAQVGPVTPGRPS